MLPLFADQGNIADTQIWIPDAELYNGAESLVETPPLALLVYNNGRVYFSRPHVYKINCSFKGATFFPYSPIFCDIDLGGWGQSGIYVNYDDALGFTVTVQRNLQEFLISLLNPSAFRPAASMAHMCAAACVQWCLHSQAFTII